MPRTAHPATRSAPRCRANWAIMSDPMSPSLAARVTMMPVEIEMSSAGIWETSPSPTVKRL
jgi:hypothetical protein